ncbi:Vacuolar transporter chaperone 2 OS=Saccharomyces cerevisiae (strain ATCC 204508 / S288c) GN=VTC2 PE=1 SV=1 [Rhizoctonia solani AG-1 IB]|uniref:Vacuolar transporter chaperone 2 n=1 Tax=Thanatephorus cucumeris (strain AG1-IB / isolate 7/3/14) TaxID=1108050 RepID=A0A0B7FCQ8_THACB|nr:Vacuolar transporter chaperone 2 OS=Saccharomyces cerevisiae (strain ATCC 204508 / S288c) GN=VTC2 PE=1 SV=1 [Rhizoctonia solani AG-1 IB]
MSSEPPRVTVTQPTPQTEPAQLNMTSSSSAGQAHEEDGSIFKRSIHVVSDLFSPFSSTALASLPRNPAGFRARSTRIDRIPDSSATDGVPNYRSVEAGGSSQGRVRVRVPKKIATPIKVETKVWLANERTWVSYLNMGVLLSTLSLALFNASSDAISLLFAYIYAAISVAVMVYGYVIYQRRITRIRKRDPGHFDQIVGPVLICVALFFAILSNFIIRVREWRH